LPLRGAGIIEQQNGHNYQPINSGATKAGILLPRKASQSGR
jgi:hypothetical protein